LGRNLFCHYKRFFHTFKMRRVVIVPCFILVHRPNLLSWMHLTAPRGDFRVRDSVKIANTTSDDKDKLFCDHCNRSRHTRETCWRLQGCPPIRGRGGHTGGRTRPRANHTSTVEMVVPTPDTHPFAIDMGGLSKDEAPHIRFGLPSGSCVAMFQ
jgi:hypothetical protein